MQVRPGRATDLHVLHQNCLAMAMESEGLAPEPLVARDAIEAALADPIKARYFVAEVDGEVVGSLFVTSEWSDWRGGWYWWIQGVFVHPDHRRTGVYTALFDAVRAAAQMNDVRKIRLYVHKDNPARAAYEAHGMQLTPYRVYDVDVGPP